MVGYRVTFAFILFSNTYSYESSGFPALLALSLGRSSRRLTDRSDVIFQGQTERDEGMFGR